MSVQEIEQAIASLEAQRGILDDEVLEVSLQALRQQLSKAAGTAKITVIYVEILSNLSTTDTSGTGQILSALFSLQQRTKATVTECGGVIDPKSGYSIIAAFSGETPAKAAENAVIAARRVQTEVQNYNFRHSSGVTLPFQVQIGIHTFARPLGDLSDDERQLLKQVKEVAPPNGIIITRSTYQLVQRKFFVQYLQSILDIRLYQLTNVKRLPEIQAHDMTFGVGLLGRDGELRRLQEIFRITISEHRAQVALIVGEAGVGKTRFITEFMEWMDLIPENVWLFSGQTAAGGKSQPYSLLRTILYNRFLIETNDPPTLKTEKFLRGFQTYLGEIDPLFIGGLIGLDFEPSVDNEQVRLRAFYNFLQYLRLLHRATDYAIVWFLEDVHWADEDSLAFLHYVIDRAHDLPLLIIATAQPTPLDMWDNHFPVHTRLDFSPLSEQATHLLVSEILRNVRHIPRRLQEAIAENAAGNPFYVWEVIRLMIQQGILIIGEQEWRLSTDTVEKLPHFAEIIQARLNELTLAQSVALQCAAVIGEHFWDRAVADLVADDTAGNIGEVLASLQGLHLIIPCPQSNFAGAQEYQFSHTMLREAILESITPQLRRHYHARIAGWLIGRGAEDYAAIIADHFTMAEEHGRASKWYGLAAKHAEDTFAPLTALRLYRKAAQLVDTNEHKIPLLLGMARILMIAHAYQEAVTTLNQALEATEEVSVQLVCQQQLIKAYLQLQDWEAALHISQQADDSVLELACLRSQLYLHLRDSRRAFHFADTVFRVYTSNQNLFGMLDCLELLGKATLLEFDFDTALHYFNEGLSLAKTINDHRKVGLFLSQIALVAQQRGDYEVAMEMYQQVQPFVAWAQEERLWIECNICESLIYMTAYRKAKNMLTKLLPEIEEVASKPLLVEALALFAETELGLENKGAASQAAYKALDIAKLLNHPLHLGKAWRVLGKSLESADCFVESLRVFTDFPLEKAKTLQAFANYELNQNDIKHGATLWREALKLYQQLGVTGEVERMKAQRPDMVS